MLAEHAPDDADLQGQAKAFASPGGFNFIQARNQRGTGTGAGGASAESGAGGAGVGGWVHLSDARNPPDFGRIAWYASRLYPLFWVRPPWVLTDAGPRTYSAVSRSTEKAASSGISNRAGHTALSRTRGCEEATCLSPLLRIIPIANSDERASLGLSSFLRDKVIARLREEEKKT